MALHDMWDKIEGLKAELDSLQPLKKADEERLWDKFNLEWNFNSNHLEGNTLTYGQTKLLLMFDKTSGDHEVREIEEMKAHDVAVRMVQDYAADKNRRLSEGDVREFNKTILLKPFWKQAITSDGQEARKKIIPGEYKTTPNSVQLASGDIFEYASPEETPAKMQELMQFFHTHLASTETHPLWLAAMLHYKFVRIHPFDDGNGRVARLLMNYVLLHNDYPPVLIKSGDKKNYLNALNKADAGDLEAFVRYIGEQLLWSLELSIKAAKGESIEEEDDVDKEIELLKRSFEKAQEGVKIARNDAVIYDVYLNSIRPLFEHLVNKIQKFNDLFFEVTVKGLIKNQVSNNMNETWHEKMDEQIKNAGEKAAMQINYSETPTQVNDPRIPDQFDRLSIDYNLSGFKRSGTDTFDISITLYAHLDRYTYNIERIFQGGKHPLSEKLYHQYLSKDEINEIVRDILKNVIHVIESRRSKK